MTPYPSTQIDAWNAMQTKLTDRQGKSLDAISAAGDQGLAGFEVADVLKWPINCVSGRMTELKKKKLIKPSGDRRPNPFSGFPGEVMVKA